MTLSGEIGANPKRGSVPGFGRRRQMNGPVRRSHVCRIGYGFFSGCLGISRRCDKHIRGIDGLYWQQSRFKIRELRGSAFHDKRNHRLYT